MQMMQPTAIDKRLT